MGTTAVRTLEDGGGGGSGLHAPAPGRTDSSHAGRGGSPSRWWNGLITNFHLPRSTLLMLVAGMAGYRRTMDAYAEAIHEGYRFYSYGDAMAILPRESRDGG